MASSGSKDDSSSEYWPITLARSDGQGYQDLDQNPLDLNEDSDVTQLERWEVIIGGHLAMQLAPKEDKRQFKLSEFPKGYELRVAIRKDQARDYYLYGHPASAKSIYRTPGEFASHALWLASGSKDNSQCPCDLCARYVEAQQKRAEAIAAWEATPASNSAAVHYSTPPRSLAGSVHPEQQAQQTQQVRPQQIQQQQQPQIPMFPGTTSLSNVFRVGELVWYRLAAWRLGVIFAITLRPGTLPGAPDTSYDFQIAPLGHTILQQQIIVGDAKCMRPFLTFSVPDSPAQIKGKPFDEVDWLAYSENERRGKTPEQQAQALQGVGLEASKLAARTINDCFSFFNKIHDEPTPDNLFRLQCYEGVYYGAEMILVNDPIRVQLGLPADGSQQHPVEPPAPTSGIMQVQQIQYLIPQRQRNNNPPLLRFQGRLLRPIRAPVGNPPPGVITPETLGPAFIDELATRNTLEKNKTMGWFWVMISPRTLQPAAAGEDPNSLVVNKVEEQVLGRFYVSAKIMGLVNEPLYQQWVARGSVDEPPSYLNNRGASGNAGPIQRKPTRRATFGRAVFGEFVVSRGLVDEAQ